MTHDAARTSAPYYDTIAVDADGPALISVPRVPTEELTMQVNVDNLWHRQPPTRPYMTSCKVSLYAGVAITRREELSGSLCPECFTEFELELAALANKTRGRIL